MCNDLTCLGMVQTRHGHLEWLCVAIMGTVMAGQVLLSVAANVFGLILMLFMLDVGDRVRVSIELSPLQQVQGDELMLRVQQLILCEQVGMDLCANRLIVMVSVCVCGMCVCMRACSVVCACVRCGVCSIDVVSITQC